MGDGLPVLRVLRPHPRQLPVPWLLRPRLRMPDVPSRRWRMTTTDYALPALGIIMIRPAGGYRAICLRCDRTIGVVTLRSHGLAALDDHDAAEHPAWTREAA